jgi:hypothetical protein
MGRRLEASRVIGMAYDHGTTVPFVEDGHAPPVAPLRHRSTRVMILRNVAIGVAAVVLAGIGTTPVWTAASAPTPRAAVLSGEATSQSVADRSFVAAAGPAATNVKKFVGVASAPIVATPGGPAFATLYVSAAVVVAGTEAGVAHVSIRLWMRGDAATPGPLYSAPKGVEVGLLEAAPAVHATPGTASNGWTPVEIDGYLAAKAVVDSLEPVWQATRFNYEFVCADCHTPHRPEEYSSMQWGIFMARMAKFAKLRPDEEMVTLKWLQTTSFESGARR